ncbi:hypothetical protein Bbelb_299410 [Branchiostoma belcheri]|nr:hypothetical protein Bbelb_299410 [Branchiostoma belcheri]
MNAKSPPRGPKHKHGQRIHVKAWAPATNLSNIAENGDLCQSQESEPTKNEKRRKESTDDGAPTRAGWCRPSCIVIDQDRTTLPPTTRVSVTRTWLEQEKLTTGSKSTAGPTTMPTTGTTTAAEPTTTATTMPTTVTTTAIDPTTTTTTEATTIPTTFTATPTTDPTTTTTTHGTTTVATTTPTTVATTTPTAVATTTPTTLATTTDATTTIATTTAATTTATTTTPTTVQMTTTSLPLVKTTTADACSQISNSVIKVPSVRFGRRAMYGLFGGKKQSRPIAAAVLLTRKREKGGGRRVVKSGEIVIVDFENERIVRYSMQGIIRGSFVPRVPGRPDYRLRPSGIAVGTRQTLWVVGFNYVINYGRNGTPLKKIELEVGTKAYGVGVSRNTLVYVMAVRIQRSKTEKEIYVYAETGGVFIRKVSLGPTTSGGPFYITVSSLIYIADTSSDQVDVYSVNGEHVSRFGEDNRCGVELSSPRGLSTDRQGNVLVTSELAGRVDLYSPQGQFIRHVVTGLRRPKDVTVAPGGRLVVIDHSPQPVQIFKLNFK